MVLVQVLVKRRAISEVIGAIFVFAAITIAASVLTYYLSNTIGVASGIIGVGLSSNSKQLDEQLSLTVAGLSSAGNNVTVLAYNTGSTTINLDKATMYIGKGASTVEIGPSISNSGYIVSISRCSTPSNAGALLAGGNCLISVAGSSGAFTSVSVELIIITQENNAYYTPL
jgi:hypothetical protein